MGPNKGARRSRCLIHVNVRVLLRSGASRMTSVMMAMVVGPRERGASRGNRFLVNKHEGTFPPRKHAACLSARTTGTGKSFVVSPREVHLDKAADLRPPRAKLPPRGGGGRPVMLSAKISTRKMSTFNTFSRAVHLTTKWSALVFLLSRPHL